MVTAVLILYGSFVTSWTLLALFMENVLNSRHMDSDARLSIVRLLHYALVLVGFLIVSLVTNWICICAVWTLKRLTV